MKTLSTDLAPAAIGPYSQAIVANGLLFASGQIPVDPATGKIPEGIAAQAEQDFAAFNEVYAKYFVSKPARSCVAVRDIPKGCLCEIEILALAE